MQSHVAGSSRRPVISVIVPVYNEQRNILLIYSKLKEFVAGRGEDYEFIFVDDGSSDGSIDELGKLEEADSRVKIIEFSRNFGKEIALTAGIRAASGDAAVLMDADLQHPVELLPEFIDKWRGGAEVVVGVRRRYERESLQKRFHSWLFYKLMTAFADAPVTPRATDYRLLDRQVIDAFDQLREHGRMTRGLIDWLGFRRDYVHFDAPKRLEGEAAYSFGKLFRLAVNSFVSLSLFPLRLAGWLGIIITAVAGVAGLFMIIEDPMLGDPLGLNFSGPAMLAVLNMFWIGIVLIALGLVALYIASIHAEVIGRPLYVTRVRPQARRSQP